MPIKSTPHFVLYALRYSALVEAHSAKYALNMYVFRDLTKEASGVCLKNGARIGA
jgi:hypothetical protein